LPDGKQNEPTTPGNRGGHVESAKNTQINTDEENHKGHEGHKVAESYFSLFVFFVTFVVLTLRDSRPYYKR